MSAFIGLCRALSHPPRQCVGLCARLNVCAGKETDTAWLLASVFGFKVFFFPLQIIVIFFFPETAAEQFVFQRFTSKHQTLSSLFTKGEPV